MERDDVQIGRLLSRREAMALLGASGAALLIGQRGFAQAPSGSPTLPRCVVRPEQTEGPYFVDERLNRADIRPDPSNGKISVGLPLELVLAVSAVSAGGCKPLPGALVDIWQCDAFGVYSDVKDPAFDTTGQKFLRGYQVTDANGEARFTTIYPGWYTGRTVHIHFKVRTSAKGARAQEFTSQLYFEDAISDQVFRREPYAITGRRTKNRDDEIFRDEHGDQLMMDVKEKGDGYAGRFELGMQLG